jgi:hypothetical protein
MPDLSINPSPLRTSLFNKTVQVNDDNLDMEHETETMKRRNVSDSDSEADKEKRERFYNGDHTIEISDFDSLTKKTRENKSERTRSNKLKTKTPIYLYT